jgi:hypothetical protein
MAERARVCPTCKLSQHRWKWQLYLPILSSLLVPVAILAASAWWTRHINRSAAAADLLKTVTSDTQNRIVEVAVDFDSRVRDLLRPCELRQKDANPEAKSTNKDEASCAADFEARIIALDRQVVYLSWLADSLFVDTDAYQRVNGLKDEYYRACGDEQEDAACGLRRQLQRILYGVGCGKKCAALYSCPVLKATDTEAQKDFAQRCALTLARLGRHTSDLLALGNVAFCSLVMDSTKRRAKVYEELFAAGLLTNQLNQNLGISQCRAILERPAAPGLPPPQPFSRDPARTPSGNR